jgi:1,4-dihydroxy-2-naphthoate octaprenyltransferase
MRLFRLFIQLSRPLYIFEAILLYLLGIGIFHYLSGPINWTLFFRGLIWLVFILLGSQYLNEYFDPDSVRNLTTTKHTPFSGNSGTLGAGKLSRLVALWAGLTCLTISASITVLLVQNLANKQAVVLMLGLIFIGEYIYAVPPFRLVSSGYGELSMSIVRVGLIPLMAFLLQGHDFHRILIMVSFPLTLLHISMLLALELPDYASDLIQGKKPILIRIGWLKGMQIHNILIFGSFIIIGLALALGLPLNVVWPVVFVVPIGIFQIWMMNRIGEGAKPNWNLLMLIATSTFALTAYILAFAFWTH